MKTSTLVWAGIGTAAAIGIGFLIYNKVKNAAPKMTRENAIAVIEQLTGQKVTGVFGDDYLIARGKAIVGNEDFFFLNDGKNKYNTKTGRAVPL